MTYNKLFIVMSGILGFLAVAFGAFGPHILKDKISADQLSIFHTGVLYHFIHAIVILILAFVNDKRFNKSAIFWGIGIILFSFSLYAYSITQLKIFAIITPFGGVSFLFGWLLIIVVGIKK